jgi:tetratricopeptide (TPR) repeat protein
MRPQKMTDLAEAIREGERLLESDPHAAAERAREIIRDRPDNVRAYRLLGTALRRIGLEQEAGKAEMDGVHASAGHPVLATASRALVRQDPATAEGVLRPYIDEMTDMTDDAGAVRLLANAALMQGRYDEAESLLQQALALVPGFTAARMDLVRVVSWRHRYDEAIAHLDKVLAAEPDNSVPSRKPFRYANGR